MIDLDELEKLLAEGNPAPWIAQVDEDNEQEGSVWCGAYEDERPAVCGSFSNDWPLDAADAETIATLRNAAPTLLALARAGRRLAETGLMVIYAHIGDSQPRPFVFCSDCGAEAAEAKDIVHEDGCEAHAWLAALAAFREADGE